MGFLDFHGHVFWGLTTAAVVVWYATITVYVAIKGARDIREMLGNLARRDRGTDGHEP
jgi:hypothetical protein